MKISVLGEEEVFWVASGKYGGPTAPAWTETLKETRCIELPAAVTAAVVGRKATVWFRA